MIGWLNAKATARKKAGALFHSHADFHCQSFAVWRSTTTPPQLPRRAVVWPMEARLWAATDEKTEERLAYVGVYVDDVLVVGSDAILTEMMERLTTVL